MDLDHYRAGLRPSMPDKMFFLERVPEEVSLFADFGCADGHLLREAHLHHREQPGGWDAVFIGYDHSPEMIRQARSMRCMGSFEYADTFGMFAARIERHRREGRKSCLVLSSVVHEVLSQEGPHKFNSFWAGIRSLGCDYIAIRDMAVEASAFCHGPVEADVEAVYHDPHMAHFLTYGVEEPGTFRNKAEFLEGLLKADYRDNWEAEYAERYFPLTVEQWLNFTTVGSGYKLRHFEHTSLPFLRNKWERQYGIHVPDPTHIKLLLQKDR